MILLIDNYDSFSYNLYQLIGSITPDIKVIRNDELSIEEIKALSPDKIIISPGPGRPENAGIIIDVVKELGKDFATLGVCLGHQAICSANLCTASSPLPLLIQIPRFLKIAVKIPPLHVTILFRQRNQPCLNV